MTRKPNTIGSRITSLIHLINKETLIKSHNEMKSKKIYGVDRLSSKEKEMSNYLNYLKESTDDELKSAMKLFRDK